MRTEPDVAERLRVLLSRWAFSPLQGMSLGTWCHVVAENRARIEPSYWLRALLTTGMSVANSWHGRTEAQQFAAKIANATGPSPVFVLGHYRSGTTHLHNLLSVDPQFSFLNNFQATFPHTFLTTEDSWFRALGSRITPRRRPHDETRLDLRVPTEDELALCVETGGLSPHMGWHFPARAQHYERYLTFRDVAPEERARWKAALQWLVKKLHYRYEARRPILKSPCHTGRVRLILEAFPHARFVNIHRHPYEVFQSTRHMELQVRPWFQYQQANLEHLDDQIIRRYRILYEAYLEARDDIPAGHLVEISYQQLVEAPLETLSAIYEGLNLSSIDRARPAIAAYLQSVSRYHNNRYTPLPEPMQHRLADEWRLAFEAWGYQP